MTDNNISTAQLDYSSNISYTKIIYVQLLIYYLERNDFIIFV